ncbi:MAG: hypothetical protein V4772_11970, partial [Pseudomonadota bacterium]
KRALIMQQKQCFKKRDKIGEISCASGFPSVHGQYRNRLNHVIPPAFALFKALVLLSLSNIPGFSAIPAWRLTVDVMDTVWM